MNYQRSTTSNCKDIRIKKFKCVAKTHFLCPVINELWIVIQTNKQRLLLFNFSSQTRTKIKIYIIHFLNRNVIRGELNVLMKKERENYFLFESGGRLKGGGGAPLRGEGRWVKGGISRYIWDELQQMWDPIVLIVLSWWLILLS